MQRLATDKYVYMDPSNLGKINLGDYFRFKHMDMAIIADWRKIELGRFSVFSLQTSKG